MNDDHVPESAHDYASKSMKRGRSPLPCHPPFSRGSRNSNRGRAGGALALLSTSIGDRQFAGRVVGRDCGRIGHLDVSLSLSRLAFNR
jgi:hypothetical protein